MGIRVTNFVTFIERKHFAFIDFMRVSHESLESNVSPKYLIVARLGIGFLCFFFLKFASLESHLLSFGR